MLADAIGFSAVFTDQRPRCLVVPEIFIAQDRRRDQPVAAKILDGREEAERLHAGDAAPKNLAHLVGEERRDVAVDGLALRSSIEICSPISTNFSASAGGRPPSPSL